MRRFSVVAIFLSSLASLASLAGCSSSSSNDGMGSMPMDGGTTIDSGMAMDTGMSGSNPSSTPVAAITGDAVFVVNGGSNSISVVVPGMNMVMATIALQNVAFPHHVNLSADRTQMLVAIPGMDMSQGHTGGTVGMKGAVLLLDAKTGKTIASRMLDQMNHNATFSPSGAEVWTSQMTMGGTVLVLDPMTLATKSTIPVGDMPAEVTFSKDGRYAFVANGMSNDVSVIDVATKKVVRAIAVGNDPVGAWPGSDGLMYVDAEQGKSVSVIDPASLTVTRTYALGFMPGMARTTPDGKELWVTNADDGKVAYFSTTATTKVGEFATGAGAHAITFSADGMTAYVTNQSAGTLSVVDVMQHKVVTSVKVGDKPNGVVYRAK